MARNEAAAAIAKIGRILEPLDTTERRRVLEFLGEPSEQLHIRARVAHRIASALDGFDAAPAARILGFVLAQVLEADGTSAGERGAS
jgi:hypothetical protein